MTSGLLDSWMDTNEENVSIVSLSKEHLLERYNEKKRRGRKQAYEIKEKNLYTNNVIYIKYKSVLILI